MTRSWRIVADWEALDEGSAEERSCFAALGIEAGGMWLTEGRDAIANRLRRTPFLSAYHLAEWFAWNWWRLRWEPRASSADWSFAHRISNIGGGYVWPDITIFSDGERTTLVSRATRDRVETPFRYIADFAAVVSSTDFEAEVDEFIAQVIERLDSMGVRDANLLRLWTDINVERSNAEFARIRKFEALMGKQPDETPVEAFSAFISDARQFGEAAIDELAAHGGQASESSVVAVSDLLAEASHVGFNVQPANGVHMAIPLAMPVQKSQVAAWRLGADFAAALRKQENLGDAPISNDLLADLVAVERRAVSAWDASGGGISFLVDPEGVEGRVVLRSKRESGRRFELARLLGDSLMNAEGRLRPATRAYTYRQKAQRSFAAELLSPYTAVLNMLQGDFSQERQLDVAEHFSVSELTVRTQLVNHNVLDREDLEIESMSAAA